MVSEKEHSYWDKIISIQNEKRREKQEKIEILLNEITKIFVVVASFFIISFFSGYVGYGALHYLQGLANMSSPVLLMSAFMMAGTSAVFMTYLFTMIFSKIKGD